MAAISTSPLPIEMSPTLCCSDAALDCAASSVERLLTISTTSRAAPTAVSLVVATAVVHDVLSAHHVPQVQLRSGLVEAVFGGWVG